MPKSMNSDLHELLAKVASLYYEEELTQNEIAARLGLSRVKIYRLLKQAKDEQVVQVVIDWPIKRAARLERELCAVFGLADALVLQAGSADQTTELHQLGQLAARYLEQTLQDGATLTVCLGRSTYETIAAIRPGFRAHVQVAPAMGSMPFAMRELDSGALARRLAQKLGGEVLDLSAPALADTPADADVLRNQRDIRRALDLARSADVALLGVGNLNPAQSGFVKGGFLSAEELAVLAAGGAAGDMAGHIFTIDGSLYDKQYDDRIIGVTLDDLKNMATTIVVAAGLAKTEAILGALRTGAVTVLVTDDRTAGNILAMENQNAK
ncbi:MAG: sugar-binding domain-containing protein [Caldilineaceae bacterium]